MSDYRFSSILFDMDGTLWDAVDTYADIWNETYRMLGIDARMTRDQLLDCMGLTLGDIIKRLNPDGIDEVRFTAALREVDSQLMPAKGGILYPGVREGLARLAGHFPLFMVSNCGPHGLDYFLQYTGLRPYIKDTLTNGQTHLSKADNIKLLMERHNLTDAVYVGDTQTDCDAAHLAGIPMIYMDYGFGECRDADFRMHSFASLTDFLLTPNSPDGL